MLAFSPRSRLAAALPALPASVLLATASLLTACPHTLVQDAGVDTDAGDDPAPIDAGDDDSGVVVDSGTPDAGEPDAGEPDGGVEPLCPQTPTCPAVARASTPVTLRSNNGTPQLVVGNGTFVVGQSTRSQIEAVLGAGVPDANNPFRNSYCNAMIAIQYTDDRDGDNVFTGTADGNDILARVVSLENADIRAEGNGGSVAEGGQAGQIGNIFGTAATYALNNGGQIRFYPTSGVQVLSNASGTVTSLGIFRPTGSDLWGANIDFANGALSNNNGTINTEVASFSDLDAVFGTNYDAEGIVDIGFSFIFAYVRTYSALGLRFAGVCSTNENFGDPCDSNLTINNIAITPPFFGKDGTLALGTAEADFIARFGASTPAASANGVDVYTSNKQIGVAYVQDEQCVERAVAFVLNFQELDQ